MTSVNQDINQPSDNPNDLPEFSARENALIAELSLINSELAGMYIGAKMTLAASANPDRLRQASVSIRELIDSLAKLDKRVPFEKDVATLKDQANRFINATAQAPSLVFTDETSIDKVSFSKIKKTVAATLKFREYMQTSSDKARKRQKVLIEAYDTSQSSLPQTDQDALLTRWMNLDTYFNRVAHSSTTTTEEFQQNITSFEEILIDLLNPPTSENFDDIDALIERLENE